MAAGLSVAGLAAGCGAPDGGPPRREVPAVPLEASRAQLEALFDRVLDQTRRRESFSEVKEEALSFSALEAMAALRDEFVAQETEAGLYYALVKLSNARRDRHLRVRPVEAGLDVPEAPSVTAPIEVLPDFSDLDEPSFFVAAVGPDLDAPQPGDRLLAVNGRPVAAYVEEFTAWVRHSTLPGLYWHLARELPRIVPNVPLDLYGETLDLTLEDAAGERYEVSLPYGDLETHLVERKPDYPGYEMLLERENFHVFRNPTEHAVLLRWLDFEFSLIQDVMDLMELAEREELLDHTLVIDATRSSGGSFGAYAIQRLRPNRFRTTYGNVRISDAGEALIERFQNLPVDEDAPDIFGLNLSRSWLRDWARTDAAEAIRRGDDYTPPTPFKLAHLPRDSGGILGPAPVHFRGPAAILLGPHGGSHLDQFVSMFADNDLALVVGMPAGGYSNTWEHEEVLTLPDDGRPLARFMWSIGHTLRPNGEVLEGNPAEPDIPMPLTRENFRTWEQDLLDQALEALRTRQ